MKVNVYGRIVCELLMSEHLDNYYGHSLLSTFSVCCETVMLGPLLL